MNKITPEHILRRYRGLIEKEVVFTNLNSKGRGGGWGYQRAALNREERGVGGLVDLLW